MSDTPTTCCAQLFSHSPRYVRPLTFSEDELNEYLSGKYQQPDIIEAWFEEALPFTEVLMQFNDWLGNHGLLNSILRNGTNTAVPKAAIIMRWMAYLLI